MNLKLFRYLLCITFGLWCSVSPASGAPPEWLYEVRFGALYHDTDNLWSRHKVENGVDFNLELVFTPKFEILAGAIRPNLGISINNKGHTSTAYLGGVYEKEWSNGIFFDTGLGIAVHDGEEGFAAPRKKALGSQVLFRVVFEVGYSINYNNRFSIMFDHISNAGLATPNQGLDTLGLRYSYRL